MNKDSIPVLHVAVKNNHADAIPVLVQEGADVNKKAPRYGLCNCGRSMEGNTLRPPPPPPYFIEPNVFTFFALVNVNFAYAFNTIDLLSISTINLLL